MPWGHLRSADRLCLVFSAIFGADPFVDYELPPSDSTPSGARHKGLLVANFVSNCTAAPRPVGYMEAFFDRVRVNESAMPEKM